jgi:hypothetical protein
MADPSAVLHLQLRDVEDMLASGTCNVYERAALEAMRVGLLNELAEMNGRAAACQMLAAKPEPSLTPMAVTDPIHTMLPLSSPRSTIPVGHTSTPVLATSSASAQLDTVQPRQTLKRPATEELTPEPKADAASLTGHKRLRVGDAGATRSAKRLTPGASAQGKNEGAIHPTEVQRHPLNIPRATSSVEQPADKGLSTQSNTQAPSAAAHKFGQPSLSIPRPWFKQTWVYSKSILELRSTPVESSGTDAHTGEQSPQSNSCLHRGTETSHSTGDDCSALDLNAVPSAAQAKPLASEECSATIEPEVLDGVKDDRTKLLRFEEPKLKLPIGDAHDKTAAVLQTKCVACLEHFSSPFILQLKCKLDGEDMCHAYCQECLVKLVEASLSDMSMFPPRCCSIPISEYCSIIVFLSQELHVRLLGKQEEINTPDRTYCSNPDCAQWIHPKSIKAQVATCGECQRKTCAVCKAAQHDGLCLEDGDVKKLMIMAQEKKWKICRQCKNMIELGRGCHHIT